MPTKSPDAEFEVGETLARSLLLHQHPDLAARSIRPLGQGWDNFMFRLGDAFTIRLPRREASAVLLQNEQRCLKTLAESLPLPIPAPLRLGEPTADYPWAWSIARWFPGEAADQAPPNPSEADRFAHFLRALHTPAPESAPPNDFRGVPLSMRAAVVEERLARLRERTDSIPPAIDRLWQDALEAPEASDTMWLHGDLHARNVLVDGGRLSAIIDWGDVTSGDVATDLASIWILFGEPSARRNAIRSYSPDHATLRRARGWAIIFGAVLLETGLVDNPRHARIGERTLRRLGEDAD